MKKKTRSLLLAFIFMIFAATLSAAVLLIDNISVFADSIENYTYSFLDDENIKDCIEKDSVIVTLTENETKKFKTYTVNDFKEVGCVGVEDLTQFTNNHVKETIRGGSSDKSMLVETDNYKRILKLNLNKSDADNVINAIKVLKKRKDILVAGPNYIYTMSLFPNDALWRSGDMWGIHSTYGIKATSAWNITTGDSAVTVGVIDSGIQADHPDLVNRISTAGLHRDFTVNPIATVSNSDLVDPNGHGTHVAGIIGAQGNNSIGVSGVCWDIRLVSLRVLDEAGNGNTGNVAQAINYAASKNIPILNYSGGGYKKDINVQIALDNYKGLFVCAAGNGGEDNIGDNNDSVPIYPSDYSYNQTFSDRVISVGAINDEGNHAIFSNYGKKSVSLFAPGENILSTYPQNFCTREKVETNWGEYLICECEFDSVTGKWTPTTRHCENGYHFSSGTSMAAPHVAGVAALLLSYKPDLTPAELKTIILDNVDEDSKLSSLCVSGGRLNALKALLSVLNVEISFEKNGGSGGTSKVLAKYGEQLPIIDLPKRAGYKFLGYYTAPTGGTQYYEYFDREVEGDVWHYRYGKYCDFEYKEVTLYAQWETMTWKVGVWATLNNSTKTSIPNESFSLSTDEYKIYYVPYMQYYDTVRWELTYHYRLLASGTNTAINMTNLCFGNYNDYMLMIYYQFIEAPCYTQNGIEVAILGKDGGTWSLKVTNRTGSTRTFEYNSKMCFKNDAANWNLSADVSSFSLGSGASRQIKVTENALATSIAISYMDGNYRKVFYADGLNASSRTMTSYANTIDTTASECIATGTLITLADGKQVPVEQLTGNEMLLVWNLHTGTFDTAPILFIDSDPPGNYQVINLSFSDGTTVKVISEHGFWDYDLNKYVYLDKNAENYIGHWFNKGDIKVRLTGVEIKEEYTTPYSPVTYSHLCYYVDGMLSMPGGISGLFNIFDVDAETMMYDEASMQLDIETYGLFTYEEFYELYPISEEVFEAFNGQYLKVAIGKGLISYEQIQGLIDRYGSFFE